MLGKFKRRAEALAEAHRQNGQVSNDWIRVHLEYEPTQNSPAISNLPQVTLNLNSQLPNPVQQHVAGLSSHLQNMTFQNSGPNEPMMQNQPLHPGQPQGQPMSHIWNQSIQPHSIKPSVEFKNFTYNLDGIRQFSNMRWPITLIGCVTDQGKVELFDKKKDFI